MHLISQSMLVVLMASVSVMPSSAFQLFPRSWLPYRKVSLQEVKNSPLSDSYQLTDVIESVEAILPMSRTSQSRSMDVATFCNAELNMEHIDAVGFDMDYTLAQYLPSFDLLAYEGTKTKLIESLGYPQLIRDLQYDRDLCQRGCVIDIQRGNILKLDKHRYLRRSQHGLTPMTSNIRKSIYRESYQEAESFTPPDFYNVDSPFSLVDACLFAQLVDLRDRVMAQMLGDSNNHLFFSDKSYKQLWKDMSRCLERCHRDGVIKKTVANNPQDYIIFDPKVFEMLRGLRAAGKKTFLVTNSLWDYTQVVMSYLLNPSEPPSMRWTDFFDVIIVGANKPAFLLDESLRNILSPMDHLEALRSIPNKIFQGGNAQVLHGLLDISSGEKILYVGDHIYSDIVRSKRSLGWRTCFIVPELTRELENLQRHQSTREEVMQMRKLQYLVDNEMDRTYVEILRLQQRANESEASEQQSAQSLATLNSKYHAMQKQVEELKELVKKKQSEYDGKFHPLWGRLFKAGFQDSRISKQIRDFACLFTSKASNIAYFSPSRSFRPIPDVRAHDLVLALGQEEVVP